MPALTHSAWSQPCLLLGERSDSFFFRTPLPRSNIACSYG